MDVCLVRGSPIFCFSVKIICFSTFLLYSGPFSQNTSSIKNIKLYTLFTKSRELRVVTSFASGSLHDWA